MWKEKLKGRKVILASASPRRQNFLKELNIPFEVRLKEIEEIFPTNLKGAEITDYLAALKAQPFLDELASNELLITSDTIVWLDNKAIGKPKNKQEAMGMLQQLSGKMHEVITSFCISYQGKKIIKNQTTKVYFGHLSHKEIQYYIDHYQPYDKAGSYGIQEWIGYIGIEKIEGSFYNVMGFPVKIFYESLLGILAD